MHTEKDLRSRPEASADTAACTLIITVESGVVAGIMPTGPVEAVVVDLDMIENEDSFEQRMQKAVVPVAPDGRIRPDDMTSLISTIVSEYRRPERKRHAGGRRAA